MAKSFLLDPAQAARRLSTRYRNQRRQWLAGGGDWPLIQTLGPPTEKDAVKHMGQVHAWRDGWAEWRGPGEVRWGQRCWSTLGTQSLPEALVLGSPEEVAALTGNAAQWARASRRFQALCQCWPALAADLPADFDTLSAWEDLDFDRVSAILACLVKGDWRGHYIRQLPIPGIDSKWLERRQGVLAKWLGKIKKTDDFGDFYALTGLRRPPQTLRLRLLDPALRAHFGGLCDIQASAEELAGAAPPVRRVFIVENLQTGLAFADLPGAAVFMKQGYAVDLFGRIPWLEEIPCYYWGDLDTHGLAILDRLRVYLPEARSLLMDEETLLQHRHCWGHEATPVSRELPRLYGDEQALYVKLRKASFGPGVRLEQERIGWSFAWATILKSGGPDSLL